MGKGTMGKGESRGTTTIYMKRENALLCKMESDQLGFSSAEEFIMLLVEVRKKLKWSKLDLECLREFGQIPKIELLTPEDLEKMGYKPVGIPFKEQLVPVVADVAQNFEETFPIKIEVKPKKKQKKRKKKREDIPYFQGIKKQKIEE